jgi:hypothetical protein
MVLDLRKKDVGQRRSLAQPIFACPRALQRFVVAIRKERLRTAPEYRQENMGRPVAIVQKHLLLLLESPALPDEVSKPGPIAWVEPGIL